MAGDEWKKADTLRHADLSARSVTELNAAERAELNRRYDNFMRHFRASNLASAPSTGAARRIRKWRP